VLDDALAKILPPLVCLLVIGLVGLDVEDIGVAKVRAKLLGNLWPSHEFVDGEEAQKLGVEWYL
jgi:hypothetical protein